MKHTAIYLIPLILLSGSNYKTSNFNMEYMDSTIVNMNNLDTFFDTDSNTCYIDYNCVIILWPDENRINSLATLYTDDDDLTFGRMDAGFAWLSRIDIIEEMLDSFNIQHYCCNKEFVILHNSKRMDIKYQSNMVDGDLILFNINKAPIISESFRGIYIGSSSSYFDREKTLEYFNK